MTGKFKYLFAALLVSALGLSGVSAAKAEPTVIRMGRGAAAEEQVWLLAARPDLAPNYGKVYTIDMIFSPNTDKRYQAMQADALDIMTSNSHSALYAAAAGLPIKLIASISRDSVKGANTRFGALESKGFKSIADLKGRTIGVVGINSATHFWASAALKRAGLDPRKDVTFVPVQFPVMGESLRAGAIDVGTFVEPFDSMETAKGGVNFVFTSKDGVPFDEELILLVAREAFLKEQPQAVRAYLSDLKRVTEYYLANMKEARQALIDTQAIRTVPEVYMESKDYYRTPDLRIDSEALKKAQDLHMELGMQEKRADIDAVVDLSYLPDAK